MTTWLALLGLHLVGLVGYNLSVRKYILDKVDKFTLATIAQTGIAVPSLLLLIVRPPQFDRFNAASILLLVAAIVLTIALQTTNVKALQYLEASVFSVLYNLRIIFTTVLGIGFLHEKFVWARIIGGGLILVAILIVKQRGSHIARVSGAAWGVGAALVLSFLNLSEKLLINHVGLINYFPMVSVIAALLMWLYLLNSNRTFDKRLMLKPKILQLMTLRAISAYGFSGALAAGAIISVANYISGMSVIFMVLFGALLLGERDYLKRKILATTVAVAGLSMILLSNL